MRRIVLLFIIAGCVVGTAGCRRIQQKISQAVTPPPQTTANLESVELAEAILWSEPYKFKVMRDPFKPLMGKYAVSGEMDEESGVELIGTVMIGDEAHALLASPFQTGVFKEKDKLGNLVIEEITANKVVLLKGKRKITLKVGGEE